MTVVFFKTGASPPVGFGCTDGRIDFAELGRKFKLDPTSIELNGLVFSKERLKSELKWGEIKADFEEVGKPVGKEDDPVIVTGEAAESTGREKGSTSKPVLDNIYSRLDSICAIVQESLSRTRASSTMNVDDLDQLRGCLVTVQVPEEEEGLLSSLLGAETEGGLEAFWEDGTYELQKREEYLRKFKSMTKSRDIIWKDANADKIKKRFGGFEFPVVAKNDLLAIVKRYISFPTIGAVLGVEIKKRLMWRGFRQAEVEFYVWASESMFPFVQLITDMERGGVAIYSRNSNDVRYRTLGSMDAVRNFVSGILKSLPPNTCEDDSENKIIVPDTFPSPSRKRFTPDSFEMSSANPQGGSSSTGRQMAFWSMVAAYQSNLNDVANVRDLDCFNVDAVH